MFGAVPIGGSSGGSGGSDGSVVSDLRRSFNDCLSLTKLQENLWKLVGNPFNLLIFVSYVLISINSTLLVRNARGEDGSYPFHQSTVIIMCECVKICMAATLYLRAHEWDIAGLKHALTNNRSLFLKNAVPAVLYGLYNNFTYFNLQHYDAAAYYILLQLKTALTGVMYKILFRKDLSVLQWGAIFVLTIGCGLKQYAEVQELDADDIESKFFNKYFFTVIFQVFLGSMAGVSIEYILKRDSDGQKGHLQLQNIFMYVNSILFNMIFIVAGGDTMEVLSPSNISVCFSMRVLPIVFSYSMMGIVTSVFLKNLDSLLKIFAVDVEIVLLAVVGWLFFGESVSFVAVVATVLVALSIYVYAVNPVNAFETTKAQSRVVDLSNDADPEQAAALSETLLVPGKR